MTGRTGVITGIGLFTPVGRDPGEVFDAVCAGRSGLVRPPEDHPLHGDRRGGDRTGPSTRPPLVPAAERRVVDRFDGDGRCARPRTRCATPA